MKTSHLTLGNAFTRFRRNGFTVVELLVSFAVIGILVSLILPAVQSAREAARRTTCRNNLKQIATGVLNFESTYRTFPGNGWGFGWVGEPGRAAGKSQPGGWIYQLLPQLDAANLWNIGSDLSGQARRDEMSILCETPLAVFKCPSRPASQIGPPSKAFQYINSSPPVQVARTDYAINEGDFITRTPIGPASLGTGDSSSYPWRDVSKATGVSWLRGGAGVSQLTDGTSHTYLVGEKYVSYEGYTTERDSGHDQTMYSGVDLDTTRWTLQTPLMDTTLHSVRSFGSAHQGGCFMAYCDGSVQHVSYEIDADVHRSLGHRSDGNVSGP